MWCQSQSKCDCPGNYWRSSEYDKYQITKLLLKWKQTFFLEYIPAMWWIPYWLQLFQSPSPNYTWILIEICTKAIYFSNFLIHITRIFNVIMLASLVVRMVRIEHHNIVPLACNYKSAQFWWSEIDQSQLTVCNKPHGICWRILDKCVVPEIFPKKVFIFVNDTSLVDTVNWI